MSYRFDPENPFKDERRRARKGSAPQDAKGLKIETHFSTPEVHPFEEITWETRSAKISSDSGQAIFEQDDIEVPASWSQLATKVVSSKYFYGDAEAGQRENSVKQLVHRVCRTIADRGLKDGYFTTEQQADTYYHELTWLCVNQYGAFNSPVWFNVGLYDVYGIAGSKHNYHWDPGKQAAVPCENSYEYPQASACFIQSVKDSMEDIMRLATSEAMLFKHGSGTGTDLSTLRSSKEKLSGGGKPSGPLSFMRVYDQIAAVIKSGGKTRRAAKMQSLKVDHPDIKEFITCKTIEEQKAWTLIEAGYSGEYNSEAYDSVMFQNSNLSVRVTDEFLQAAEKDDVWITHAVTSGEKLGEHSARELMQLIAEGTRICGDPGVQYHSTINRWHTCPNSGAINASNPCSEYMFVDDSACNLASLNLMKFRKEDGTFDVDGFKKAVRLFIIAQEILVDNGSYPDKAIAINSHRFRPLGLGFANLGSLVMSLAMPYDSDQARSLASAISAIMTGTAYAVSAEIAELKGAFVEFEKNKDPMLKVINMHRQHAYDIPETHCPDYLRNAAKDAWDQALDAGSKVGFRNAQTTVLAPTGTIGFLMDCDTTGIEPDIALVKYKLLAGGGMLKLVNRTVPMALERLGYNPDDIKTICDYIDEHETIENAPKLIEDHLPVFDCAFKPRNGKRFIKYQAHLKMMAAVQPFISGAISKTINMPKESTTEEIMAAYVEGWKLGLKAVAIYRDGSKRLQPVSTDKHKEEKAKAVVEAAPARPFRRRLPDTRQSITHKFSVAGHEGYLTVGLYEDGQPGEMFITMAKEGSTVGGLMDVIGTCTSMALQYGVPLITLVDKFRHARFEPSGMTSNRDIPFAKSLIDYIFCWLGCQFIPGYADKNLPNRSGAVGAESKTTTTARELVEKTKDLAHKIAEAKAAGNGAKKKTGRDNGSKPVPAGREVKAASVIHNDRLTEPAAGRISALVGPTLPQTEGPLESEAVVMQQFSAQFAHFGDDAPACDICGAITVRNGTCYKCFNCGNSMGCS
ncbi:MAG: vitamin B12-dependent ribonucleotide reductase [Sedimentisphaerales bacterium]|jgi:ribonucleoside-diphosphate reductase alpha chain|nr:vitamin B12-dependent ribonucleotide reductase [Sedimentisphaerales bacterium]HNY77695.1 vitamin B12-dependent ribonucleotide reductase [Sedimentisphaerales bacterium]HOC63439.1 vitamin B12-dependent ribonucleotide reductase [Sedimentisphaerales bacterium]HOH63870.1 vitamin B12-dependent ribonucleotide reductase [Sedimentisphaerales bacterium]HPY49625.1 vitamin B12-dependent ribonucleotide reductase [Sedimentisphaerales bacterium]